MTRLKNAKHLKGWQVAEIKWYLKDGQYTSLKEIADKYKCSATMIANIRDGKNWDRIKAKEPV